jgi:GNAT superfamily N-acetyltransferase
MRDDPMLMRRVLRAWALDAAAFARVLADQDPTWGSETFELAGGQLVLCGPGLYVNRALAVALDRPLADHELATIEARSTAIGVLPAIEVSPATDGEAIDELTARGYVAETTVEALRRPVDDGTGIVPGAAIAIERADGDLLPLWQETSALGWGHVTPTARRASDAFARAAAVIDGPGFLLGRADDDGRPVGCASLTIRDGVATFGGMSTVPAERRRGVQSALIRHRLAIAHAAGCDLATSTAVPGSDSERNLIRHGFEPWFALTTMVRPARPA